jgi:AraC family transcriptional regulator
VEHRALASASLRVERQPLPARELQPAGFGLAEYRGDFVHTERRPALASAAQLVYCLAHRGRWHYRWNGTPRQIRICAGQIFVVPPGVETVWEFCAPHHCAMLTLPAGLLEDARLDLGLPRSISLRDAHHEFDPALGQLIQSLIHETRDDAEGSAPASAALLRLLTIHLFRRYSDRPGTARPAVITSARLQAALEFVDLNLGSEISTARLSRATDLSPYHFTRLFKKAVGQTPHQYVLARRIERAKQLLSDRAVSMVDVALEVGFPNQSYFGTVFRRLTGMTPRQFRAEASIRRERLRFAAHQ